jgi:hypothetical protein
LSIIIANVKRLIPILAVFVLACQALTPLSGADVRTRPVARAAARSDGLAADEGYPYPPPSQNRWKRSSARAQPETSTETSPEISTFTVRYHPDGPLYVGDQVSIEVIAPEGIDLEHSEVQVSVKEASIGDLGSAKFGAFGIGGRYQATMSWVWDTQELEPGNYTLDFNIKPDIADWTEEIVLLLGTNLPAPEPQAHWLSVEIDCCVVHYISGTPAARDITDLLEVAEAQSLAASQNLGSEFEEPIEITILPRVLGHGGFASREIHVSYLDRNYANSNFSQVLQHEMVHILDGQLGGELRPSLFIEGLAVYLTGGHYKKEPLLARAAVLSDLGWYLPLVPLADDFYNSQHEVGYLQSGALIQYMVRTWGWEAFSDFYRDIQTHESGEPSQAIDTALQAHFGLTFEQLERRFVNELQQQHINPDLYDDVRLIVSYYETVRRYQQVLDPSAYFLTAWLPEGSEMRERELVADYLRRPSARENIILENLIIKAGDHIQMGDFEQAERILSIVNEILDQPTPVEQNLSLPQGS